MTNDHFPPGLKSQVLKLLVKLAGPHQTAKRALFSNAAKTRDGGAAISRDFWLTAGWQLKPNHLMTMKSGMAELDERKNRL
jgi:hypothetical protein